uniref:DJ-1_PfpI domain-containing protein n=1 Tax=Anopheles minimus TaxID=112268 RepID=A0A182W4D0_9DIPT
MALRRALALIARGSEEMELVITVDVLRRCNVDVTIALVQDSETATGNEDLIACCSRGVNIKADTTLQAYIKQHAATDDGLPDAIILPGGLEGAKTMARVAAVGDLLDRQQKAGKLVAAICAAPTVLAEHGKLFAGRRLTSYPSFREKMTEDGYVWEAPAADSQLGRVVQDNNLITSLGPATTFDFGLAIGALLVGKDVADKVAAGLLYNQLLCLTNQLFFPTAVHRRIVRNNLRRFRLVTFDVTDTLLEYAVRPERHYAQVINSVLEPRIGITLLEEQIGRSFGLCFRSMNQKFPNFGSGRKQTGQQELEDESWRWWWRTLVERVIVDAAASSNCHNVPSPLLSIIAEQLIDDYTYDGRRVCWRQRPGVDEFLRKLRTPPAGQTLGIVSNFDPRLTIILRNNGIAPSGEVVDFVLTSYEAGVEKPDPAIFETALRKANLLQTGPEIKPQEALHIGNLCREDYNGARSAGWCALLVNVPPNEKNRKLLTAIPSGHVFAGLPELQQRLEGSTPLAW